MTAVDVPADVVALTRERDDLLSRLACVVEAACWDRPYDERIAAIRGMCDLTQNGLTRGPTDDTLAAAALREAAQDLREYVHDRMRPDTWQRDVGDHACAWLERRADLIGGDRG